jgi:hypothetical protein
VLVETLNVIADLEPESFEKLAGEYPGFISADPGRFSVARKLKNGYAVGVNYSAKTIYRFCTQAIESIGLTAEDWVVETE